MTQSRSELKAARRIVIKIGSNALSRDAELPRHIAGQVAALCSSGRSLLIVSSGAIALGSERLGYRERPRDIGELQAAAAAGQSVLMHRYELALASVGLVAAQVLLTHADLADRTRVNNARRALAALLEAGAVPIINENDTVAIDELRFGDNDQLASMVAPLVSADAVIFLTNVDGVLDQQGQRIPILPHGIEVTPYTGDNNALGSGGIQSKLDAARKAQLSGASAVVANASEPDVITRVLAGEDVGTLFQRFGEPLRARKHWIAYTLRPRGSVLIDAGAVEALRVKHCSLLPVGVLGVRGDFHPGDAVRLLGPGGEEVGRGLARLGAIEVARAAGKRAPELEALFGGDRDVIVVHRDDLVMQP